MKNTSIWLDEKKSKNYNKLMNNTYVDVLIIGGGITGISTAFELMNSNLKICIVEKNKLLNGVTSKTTGKLTYLQDIYTKLIKYHGLEKTKLYLKSQIDAINIVKERVKKYNIECDLEKTTSYLFDLCNNLKKEKDILKKLGIKYKETTSLPNKKECKDSIYVNDSYVFHPIKYLNSLLNIVDKSIDIYENTPILSINKEKDYYICKTNNAIIKTKYIVLATHYPYFLIPFLTPLKCYIEKSYIAAYKTNNNLMYNSLSISKPTISTRYCYNKNHIYKLLLVNSHNTATNENIYNNFSTLYKYNPDYIWSNKDIITNDSLPFIGLIDKNFLISTGYNTWGMTNGTIAGKVLCDIILKTNNKYIDLFNPRRNINLGKVINFPLIVGSNMYSFIKSKIIKNKTWYKNNIIFETRNNKQVAIYRDDKNKEHIVYNLCPHLKCSLIFNEIERTWDCPCHGSRFDIDGNVIEGPSNYSIRYEEKN